MNRELNPTVLVEFVELSMVDPLAEDIDIALVYAPFEDERVVTQPMFSEPRVAVLPQSHRLAEAASIYIGVVPNGSVVVQLDLGASPARR